MQTTLFHIQLSRFLSEVTAYKKVFLSLEYNIQMLFLLSCSCLLYTSYVTMDNAGVCVYRDEKPAIFAPEGYAGGRIVYPAFFSSREVKEMGIDTTKTVSYTHLDVYKRQGMYHADQYVAPEGQYTTIHAVDGTAWYKQYAVDAVDKSPYMAPDGSIAFNESIRCV